jgi:GNAT superfamily N-acetyltransferase
MSAIQPNDTIAVRRLASADELAAAVENEALRTMGIDLANVHSIWATTDNTAVAIVFAGGGDDGSGGGGDGGGWMEVMRGPVRSAAGGGEAAAAEAASAAGTSADDAIAALSDVIVPGYDGPGEHSVYLAETVRAQVGGLVAGLTIPRSAVLGSALERWQLKPGADWDLMVCDAPPPLQPGEALVQTGLAETEIQAFLDRVNPHHSVRATDPTVKLWVGVRDERGALLAAGALTRRRTGIGYLASIATDPAARGAGYGSAVTAYLTRQVFNAGEPRCTLAHYHPNHSARRIYLRLGYRTMVQNHSTGFH